MSSSSETRAAYSFASFTQSPIVTPRSARMAPHLLLRFAGARPYASACRCVPLRPWSREMQLRRLPAAPDECHDAAVVILVRLDTQELDAIDSRMLAAIASMIAASRPSLKFGTHSTICFMQKDLAGWC